MIGRIARRIRREETNRLEAALEGCRFVRTRPFSGDVPLCDARSTTPYVFPSLSRYGQVVRSFALFLSSFSPSFSVTTTNSSPLLRGLISSSSVASPWKSGVQNADTSVSLVTSTARRSFSDSTRDGWLHSSVRLHSAAYAPHFVSTRRTRTHGFQGSTHGRIEESRQVQEKKSAVSFHSVPFFERKAR